MRLIDADKIQFSEIDEIGGEYEPYLGCSKRQIDNLPTVEAIPKDQYEARLKAEKIAMLEELKAEIEELYPKARKTYRDGLTSYCEGVDDSREIIQQKINALKEEAEDDKAD